MSLCSKGVRVWPCSRNTTFSPLLPFLYQTATIQRCTASAPILARRNLSSRRNGSDDNSDAIPFDDGSLPRPVDRIQRHKTSITGSERAAFEKLYRKFEARGNPKNEKDHLVELDQIADEYYEDDEDTSAASSLDKIFDEVMKGHARSRPSRSNHGTASTEQSPQKLQPPQPKSGTVRKRQLIRRPDAIKLKPEMQIELKRVDGLLKSAKTDRELWNILNREVFNKVRSLDLDLGPNIIKKPARGHPDMKDARITFENYPKHLITAVTTLRSKFPASQLPSAILPTVQSLGRSSYALGATTALYRHLIHTAWVQQVSYPTIDRLLIEMNNNAIEFDLQILSILKAIVKQHHEAVHGAYGSPMRSVHRFERFLEDVGKIEQWRDFVADRLGVDRPANMAEQKKIAQKTIPLSGWGHPRMDWHAERMIGHRKREELRRAKIVASQSKELAGATVSSAEVGAEQSTTENDSSVKVEEETPSRDPPTSNVEGSNKAM